MDNVTDQTKQESMQALQSAIRKAEKACNHMSQKDANTILIEKRLNALRVAFAILDKRWHLGIGDYPQVDLLETKQLIKRMIQPIKAISMKNRLGPSQKTLIERRIRALELAVQAIEESREEADN